MTTGRVEGLTLLLVVVTEDAAACAILRAASRVEVNMAAVHLPPRSGFEVARIGIHLRLYSQEQKSIVDQ